jgi:hypothetical protein
MGWTGGRGPWAAHPWFLMLWALPSSTAAAQEPADVPEVQLDDAA